MIPKEIYCKCADTPMKFDYSTLTYICPKCKNSIKSAYITDLPAYAITVIPKLKEMIVVIGPTVGDKPSSEVS